MASDAEESGFEDDSAYEYPSTSESSEEDEAPLDDVESDEALPRTVASVKERSGCKCGCLEGKDLEITMLLQSLSKMTKREKHVSLMTALSVAEAADSSERRAPSKERRRFAYMLPVVGVVCRRAFVACYDIGDASIRQLNTGDFMLPGHGGAANQNAAKVDTKHIKDWLEEVAHAVGEIVPIKMRKNQKKEGRTVNYYTDQPFKMLPSYLTWERLYNDYTARYSTIDTSPGRCPSYISFFKIAKKCYPDIRIRCARSNVCDRCSIFKMRIKHMTTDTTESELRGREFEPSICEIEMKLSAHTTSLPSKLCLLGAKGR
ncbi:hypothetical protein PF010_g20653 [Phytophthora fragariae]|uniref:Uncharacterized protein n=1 Tax=Phytophthora fragariae TaxID=53985 RepID=A0A6G0N814_9STRA|nr:hypothetical protein PF010_g20653 [Phytophthora fragariae]KAE9197646.1 hypothetical protein PF004_g19768 [Phytophthora fragariae]